MWPQWLVCLKQFPARCSLAAQIWHGRVGCVREAHDVGGGGVLSQHQCSHVSELMQKEPRSPKFAVGVPRVLPLAPQSQSLGIRSHYLPNQLSSLHSTFLISTDAITSLVHGVWRPRGHSSGSFALCSSTLFPLCKITKPKHFLFLVLFCRIAITSTQVLDCSPAIWVKQLCLWE